jgi:peroxiredoxin
MLLALLLARLLLVAMFIVAGLAKLVDLAGSRQALIDFGVPPLLATPFGLLLPLAELIVAVTLVLSATAWWAAIGALALLLLFVIGIGYNLARGRHPDCHCFGQLHSAPTGWPTLLRNLLLAAIAAFIVGFGRTNAGLSALDWIGTLALAQRIEVLAAVILAALLAAEGWLLWQMLRQQGRLLLRIEELEAQRPPTSSPQPPVAAALASGLPVGMQAPGFSLSSLSGETLTLDFLRAGGKPIVLLFSDPGCGPCNALLPEVGRWQREYAGKATVVLISRGTPQANRSKASEHGITQVLLQTDREVAQAYQAYGTPSAVLIRPSGTIGSSLAQGADAIRALVAQAVGLPALHSLPSPSARNGKTLSLAAGNGQAPHAASQPATLQIGESAPTLSLPDLSGQIVSLSDFRGHKTLVLFWNPACGFCQRMLDELKAWEARPPKDAPKLLVVSSGTIEANQALGLRSPLVLDQNMSVGSKFGANGTPMAVLVDAEGRIASEVAAGAPAVLALAGSTKEPSSTRTQ